MQKRDGLSTHPHAPSPHKLHCPRIPITRNAETSTMFQGWTYPQKTKPSHNDFRPRWIQRSSGPAVFIPGPGGSSETLSDILVSSKPKITGIWPSHVCLQRRCIRRAHNQDIFASSPGISKEAPAGPCVSQKNPIQSVRQGCVPVICV